MCCSLVVVELLILCAEGESVRPPSLEMVSATPPSAVQGEALSPNQRQSKQRHIRKGSSLRLSWASILTRDDSPKSNMDPDWVLRMLR